LDVTTQARILALIREIQAARDTGVLFITHDFGVVAEIADRVAVMQSGRIVETGDAHQILSQPEHPYTRMLIGAVPSLAPAPRDTDDGAPVVLSTEGLSKTYSGHGLLRRQREVVAAKGVSIQVRRGQTLGIVGESGSGKSTVARCVMRLTDPTGGDISLGGSDFGRLGARALWAARKRVQIVFQDPYRSLNPRRTIGRSMTEGPINYGMARAEARARALELLALVGIERGAIDRYPHQFSGGQRQRICIARALALEPELLVADEPVSALDVSVQAQVLRLLDDVRRRYHLGMLFITHDLRVAAQVCDTVAVMLAGEIVEHGPVAEVFERPSHDYTRRLLAAAPGRAWNFGASGVRE
jgi:peptide/nickel transport system ATP-binding protein